MHPLNLMHVLKLRETHSFAKWGEYPPINETDVYFYFEKIVKTDNHKINSCAVRTAIPLAFANKAYTPEIPIKLWECGKFDPEIHNAHSVVIPTLDEIVDDWPEVVPNSCNVYCFLFDLYYRKLSYNTVMSKLSLFRKFIVASYEIGPEILEPIYRSAAEEVDYVQKCFESIQRIELITPRLIHPRNKV